MVEEGQPGSVPASPPRRRRTLVLLGGLVAIVLWQSIFFSHGYPETTLESSYRLDASGGVLLWQPDFVYFLYYLNLYPIATISTSPLEYSVEGAKRLITEEGGTLVMDRYWTMRYGDLAKTYLYLPHVWLKGRPVKPRMLHANALGFTLALLALFAALWSAERTLLGAFLVAFIGSNPFQVHQVYANNNLFGWPITVTVLLMALHIPLMRGRAPRTATAVAIALTSGFLLGTVKQIRTEPVLVLVAAVGIYLTASRLRYWLRLTLVLLLAAAYAGTTALWTGYFNAKYREAYRVVKQAGGHPYDGPRHPYHFFWHAIWCGLGDFDQKYGYQWSDLSAVRYAWPVMQRRGVQVGGFLPDRPDPWDVLTLGAYWDRGGQYAQTPFELPAYIEVARDKVLRDVFQDPWWFASIIGRRIARLLTDSTAPSLAVGNGWGLSLRGEVPWGLLTLVLAAWLLWERDWFHLKLIAFTLPLAATALVVFSGGGTAYYSIAHLVGLAIVGAEAWARLHAGRLDPHRSLDEHPRFLPTWALTGRWRAALALAALLGLLVLGLFARRVGALGSTPPPVDRPDVAIMRFDNKTSNESLAWVGDALSELCAEEIASAGVRALDPDAVDWLDADLVVWTSLGTLSSPRTKAVNIVADRSGVERVVAGRLYPDQAGPRACVEVLAPGARASLKPEHCELVDMKSPYVTAGLLARAVLPVLGSTTSPSSAPPPASAKAFRLYTEARRSIRRQMWAKAARQFDRSLREDPGLQQARVRGARVSSRWRPLAPEVLRDLTGEDRPLAALAVLRTRVSSHPDSIEARMDLGRLLIDLELFDDATRVLRPLLRTPGVPADACGLLATAFSSLGEMGRGYQAVLECRRRSWQEPRGNSLLGEHLTRWGYFELATTYLDDAEGERPGLGMPRLLLEDLLSRWSIRAWQGDWPEAQQLASRMMPLDDPRAKGAGLLRLATGHLFGGRLRLGGALAEEAAFRFAEQDLDASEALGTAVQVRFERNDAAGALALVRRARPSEPDLSDRRVQFWEAVVLARLHQWTEAVEVRRRLAKDLSDLPGPSGRRLLHHLDGEVALQRGDASGAVASLSEAARLLPARGFCGDHVPVWYALARANLAAGRPEPAKAWLQRITGASHERLCWPIPYARSLALLGRIEAAAGRPDEAAEAYGRFLNLWGEGDLADAERDEARRFLLAREGRPSTVSAETEAEPND